MGQLRHQDSRHTIDRRHRQVDLLDQQHKHQTQCHDAHHRALKQQIRQVLRREEDIALESEEDPQCHQADHDGQRPQISS